MKENKTKGAFATIWRNEILPVHRFACGEFDHSWCCVLRKAKSCRVTIFLWVILKKKKAHKGMLDFFCFGSVAMIAFFCYLAHMVSQAMVKHFESIMFFPKKPPRLRKSNLSDRRCDSQRCPLMYCTYSSAPPVAWHWPCLQAVDIRLPVKIQVSEAFGKTQLTPRERTLFLQHLNKTISTASHGRRDTRCEWALLLLLFNTIICNCA